MSKSGAHEGRLAGLKKDRLRPRVSTYLRGKRFYIHTTATSMHYISFVKGDIFIVTAVVDRRKFLQNNYNHFSIYRDVLIFP
jgi:hypothetical protein